MLGWVNDARMRASRSKRARRSELAASGSRKTFERDFAAERRVTRPVHLPHATGAERGNHLVRPETIAGHQQARPIGWRLRLLAHSFMSIGEPVNTTWRAPGCPATRTS